MASETPDNDFNKNTMELLHDQAHEDRQFKIKAGIFLASMTGIATFAGFGATLASVKKKDPEFFSRGTLGSRGMTETGASLAMRALGWGSLYAWVGCGVLFFTIWKISGANDMKEFKMKVGSILPRISSDNPPQGRTKFEGLSDLLNYISSDEATETAASDK